jgi:type IV pilus assembly protein PilC
MKLTLRKESTESTTEPKPKVKPKARRDKKIKGFSGPKPEKFLFFFPKKARPAKPVRYKYVAIDEDGKNVKGTEKALSTRAAHAALIARGLRPIEVRQQRNILKFEVTKKKVDRALVANFSRQLAVFLKAGVPIMNALEVIVVETKDKVFHRVLVEMIGALRDGYTFATAAAEHPEAFPNFYVGILESAELTGNLDSVLLQLSEYIDRDVKAKGKIKSALIYPVIVGIMGIIVIAILVVFVLPRFVVFFKSLNAKLPLPTRMLMSFSAWTIHYGLEILAFIAIIVIGFIVMKKTEKGHAQLNWLMLHLWVIGPITQTAVLERTCRILSSLIRAGVDLPRSMSVTAESANNAVYRKALEQVRVEMMEGGGLADPIERTGLFPGTARQMFRVGEETGTLEQQLGSAADYFGDELAKKLDHATSLFEPAIIVVMGVVVGFVALALISAMYGIYNQVKVG